MPCEEGFPSWQISVVGRWSVKTFFVGMHHSRYLSYDVSMIWSIKTKVEVNSQITHIYYLESYLTQGLFYIFITNSRHTLLNYTLKLQLQIADKVRRRRIHIYIQWAPETRVCFKYYCTNTGLMTITYLLNISTRIACMYIYIAVLRQIKLEISEKVKNCFRQKQIKFMALYTAL